MNQRNRKRGLADVVGMEAWHRPFSGENADAELHIDVVFQSGRFGTDTSDPVRFQLGVRRAEVVLVTPDNEPVRVVPASVVRDAPAISGQATTRRTMKREVSASAAANASSAPKLNLSGSIGASASDENVIESAKAFTSIEVLHMLTGDGDHRWILRPSAGDFLEGRPWDSATPRLTLSDTRGDRTQGVEPAVRIEVRCAREDLLISHIALKEKDVWTKLTTLPGHRNRIAAAEALIRTRLFEQGLIRDDADLTDDLLQMTLAIATPEA
jgi:hypothetical protein